MTRSGGFVRVSVVIALLAVGACERDDDDDAGNATATTTTTTTTATTATSEPRSSTTTAARDVVLDDDGVVVDDGEETAVLRFDESGLAEVKNALTSVLGSPAKEVDQQCDSGADHAVTWAGLAIYTTDGRFTGWYADRERLTTDGGVRPGSTKADLDKAFGSGKVEIHETTLGTEWSATGYAGIFEGDAKTKVAGMWAGTNCVFR